MSDPLRQHGLSPASSSPLLPLGFPRQEYWNGLPYPPSGDLPNPGIEPLSAALAGGFFTAEPPGKPQERPPLQMEGFSLTAVSGLSTSYAPQLEKESGQIWQDQEDLVFQAGPGLPGPGRVRSREEKLLT